MHRRLVMRLPFSVPFFAGSPCWLEPGLSAPKALLPTLLPAVLPVLLLAMSAAGCDGGDGSCAEITCDVGTVCDPVTAACIDATKSCITNSDCGDDTKKCLEDVCVPRCHDVVCDTEHGEICDPDLGQCVGGNACEINADCTAANTLCEKGGCVGGRFAQCGPGAPCAENMDCISNGLSGTCTARCDATSDCAPFETCNLDPGGGALTNHCQVNLCRPGSDGLADGFQDAEYMSGCNVLGSGDGTCLGPLQLGTTLGGLCMAPGNAQPGEPCNSEAGYGQDLACDGGLCLTGDGATDGVCGGFCSLFDGNTCADQPGGQATACVAVFETNGICAPQVESAAAAGEACTQVPDGPQPCIEEHACVPGTSGGNECRAICDIRAQAGATGSCAIGQCTPAGVENPVLGTCN